MTKTGKDCAAAALELYALGYLPFPQVRGTHKPKIKGWQDAAKGGFGANLVGPEDGVAILLGVDCVALDLDYDVDGIHRKVIDLVESETGGKAPCKVGSKGCTYLFRCPEQNDTKVMSRNGKVVMELLGRGRATTMPPSLHPTGVFYEYLNPPVAVQDLLPVPAAVLSMFSPSLRAEADPDVYFPLGEWKRL